MTVLVTLSFLAALMWVALLLLPWRPWSTREHIEPDLAAQARLDDVSVLIPARDEASCISVTLRALDRQGTLARITLIDDQSSDGTASIARELELPSLHILAGTSPPPGWSGKLWALEQGLQQVESTYVLLLDADIELAPGILRTLKTRLLRHDLTLVSVMAELPLRTLWDRLLLPPFIFFFKLIYPFAVSNSTAKLVAAAAGGCILLDTAALRGVGGFAGLHDAIIDDCTLARRIKARGGRTWIGLSHAVRAVRPYDGLQGIWNMVARTAFTQLRYSIPLLLLCTVLLLLGFVQPMVGLLSGNGFAAVASVVALQALFATYLPTVRYYRLPDWWVATLPFAACLFLAMTWTSARRYWSGERSRWKARSYARLESD